MEFCDKEQRAMFYRKIYNQMKAWKETWGGKSALLIEGARRVGKSTVVEEFAKNEYESYLLIDFSIARPEVFKLFEDISDLNFLFLRLKVMYQVQLEERKSVIIFDEVQFCPRARQAIKHLVKDGRYDYIETGSLISIHRNVKDILIPSEEMRLTMVPMDFEEFLVATGKGSLPGLLREVLKEGKPLGEGTHRYLMRQFRLYMLVGGMPQAVETFIRTNDFHNVDDIKRAILDIYEDDFRKLDDSGNMTRIFNAIPSQLNKNASRYQISSVLPNERAVTMARQIYEMQESKTVLISYAVTDPGFGMGAARDLYRYKIFLADTGLFVTLMFMDTDFTKNIIYEKLLSDKNRANLGYLYENMTAQMLTAMGFNLYYYTFPKENSRYFYEIDFMIPDINKVIPVEVKSSGYKAHSSLDAFQKKYSDRISRRFLFYTKDFQKDKDIYCYPMYLVPFLK